MSQTIDFQKKIEQKLREKDDNHTEHEEDPEDGVFHASWMGYCPRNILLSKANLKVNDFDDLGRFHTGTMIHEFMENEVGPDLGDDVELEEEIPEVEIDGITFTGTADVVDHENEVIYDFKSRGGWYKFDPPVQRHLDQLYIYMKAFGYDKAQVVYVSKKDMEVRTYPENGTFGMDHERFWELVKKAEQVRQSIKNGGVPESVEDLNARFKPCDNFFCESDPELALDQEEDEEVEEE